MKYYLTISFFFLLFVFLFITMVTNFIGSLKISDKLLRFLYIEFFWALVFYGSLHSHVCAPDYPQVIVLSYSSFLSVTFDINISSGFPHIWWNSRPFSSPKHYFPHILMINKSIVAMIWAIKPLLTKPYICAVHDNIMLGKVHMTFLVESVEAKIKKNLLIYFI